MNTGIELFMVECTKVISNQFHLESSRNTSNLKWHWLSLNKQAGKKKKRQKKVDIFSMKTSGSDNAMIYVMLGELELFQ